MQIRNTARTIVLDSSGRILLLRRARNDDHRPGEWDFPGGGIDDGEPPVVAAVRETSEEAGIALHEGDMHLVYMVTSLSNDGSASINRFLFATRVPGGDAVTLSHEHEEYTWLPIEEALRMLTHPVFVPALRYVFNNGLLEF